MTNRPSEDAAPDNEQSATAQTDNTSPAALDKTGARRKRSAAGALPATTERRNTSGLNLSITCQKMSGSYGGPWTTCPSSGGFCTPLAARVFVCHAVCPRIKGTYCARTLGWHACANSWLFWGYQHLHSALQRACEPSAPAQHHQGFFTQHPTRLKQYGSCGKPGARHGISDRRVWQILKKENSVPPHARLILRLGDSAQQASRQSDGNG